MSIFDKLTGQARDEVAKLSADVKSEIQFLIDTEHGFIETIRSKWPLLVVVFALGVAFGHFL